MKQKLLTDIELDVHELRYLMDSYTKESTSTLSELLKRTVLRMQGQLDELLQELNSVQETALPVSEENESPVVEEHETVLVEEQVSVAEECETSVVEEPAAVVVEETVIEETVVEETESVVIDDDDSSAIEQDFKPSVLGESIKLAAGLRHSISLNDSFRFSRELFGGDIDLMNRVIEQISVMSSYKTAVAFLSSKVDINPENETLNDFLELLKKYFNQSA